LYEGYFWGVCIVSGAEKRGEEGAKSRFPTKKGWKSKKKIEKFNIAKINNFRVQDMSF